MSLISLKHYKQQTPETLAILDKIKKMEIQEEAGELGFLQQTVSQVIKWGEVWNKGGKKGGSCGFVPVHLGSER